MKLHELVSVVRSKNAGPFLLTVDMFFRDRAAYDLVYESGLLQPESVARLYGIARSDVVGSHWEPNALGAKVTLRKTPSTNDPACGDLFGSSQHIPLAYADVVPGQPAPSPEGVA